MPSHPEPKTEVGLRAALLRRRLLVVAASAAVVLGFFLQILDGKCPVP